MPPSPTASRERLLRTALTAHQPSLECDCLLETSIALARCSRACTGGIGEPLSVKRCLHANDDLAFGTRLYRTTISHCTRALRLRTTPSARSAGAQHVSSVLAASTPRRKELSTQSQRRVAVTHRPGTPATERHSCGRAAPLLVFGSSDFLPASRPSSPHSSHQPHSPPPPSKMPLHLPSDKTAEHSRPQRGLAGETAFGAPQPALCKKRNVEHEKHYECECNSLAA